MKVGACKRARVILVNDLLSVLRRKLFEFFGQLGAWRKDGCAIWSVVYHVYDLSVALTVLLQKRGDDLPRGGRVGALQLALGILVLSVDDDESAVGDAGC